jgi:5,6-dimethylbenzimidazole synthase
MDIFTAIRERRSCRNFLPDPVSDETIEKLLEAAIWAPSPANNQPWEFIVIKNQDTKKKIHEESLVCKKKLFEKSGWKWIDRYQLGFLLEAPVIIAVIGDPEKTGAHKFLEGTEGTYQHGCAAAIQNMLLAAHALGLGALWYTLFKKEDIKKILEINPAKDPVALICLGMPATIPAPPPRNDAKERTRYLR